MKTNPNEDFTTNRNQTAEDAADNEQSMEDQNQATEGAANKDLKPESQTGSHKEGEYDRQSTLPTMHPDKKIG